MNTDVKWLFNSMHQYFHVFFLFLFYHSPHSLSHILNCLLKPSSLFHWWPYLILKILKEAMPPVVTPLPSTNLTIDVHLHRYSPFLSVTINQLSLLEATYILDSRHPLFFKIFVPEFILSLHHHVSPISSFLISLPPFSPLIWLTSIITYFKKDKILSITLHPP